jgi:hypothetical protein
VSAVAVLVRPSRWVVAYTLLVAAVASAIFTARLELAGSTARVPVISAAHPAAPFPSSPKVEAVWGIRFTDVIVVADNGGVELRYQVLDQAKAAKIHLGNAMSNELPSIRVDGGATITPSTVLMHFHHGDTVSGESYSIVYGNAAGAVRAGDFVTIVMKDGLTVPHAQVSN